MSAPASAVDAPATPDLLAASILAVFTMVRADLAEAAPQVGRIAEQAGAAFGRHEHQWLSLSCGDVAGWFPADRAAGRARLFLSGFGAHLNLAAARALDVGVQMQLARGWHPDVAWQRALAGYGLDERAMRGYVGAAMAASAQAGAVVAEPVRARVERALCEYAQRCAADAARAARRSTARVLRRVDAAPPVAGLAVRARDTGRLLMLQRALDPADPAGGTWEFPGGHAEPGETPGAAAVREWQEEVGRRLPPVTPAGTWRHGPYVGIVADIDREADIPIGRGRGSIVNPDDPDRDAIEQLAWWDVDQLARNPAVRTELRASLAKVRAALGVIAKAGFDPREPRDAGGRWTDQGRPRARVKERVRDDGVDALLSGPVADEQPAKRTYQQRTYQQRNYRQYRTYQPERVYQPERNYRPERTYGGERNYAEPRRRTVIHHLLVLGGKRPGDYAQQPSAPAPGGHVGAFFIYSDPMTSHAYASPYNPDVVDFDWVRQARDMIGEKGSNEAAFTRDPWDLVPDRDRVDIDPDDWGRIIDAGEPLWHGAIDDARRIVPSLTPEAIAQIAEDAGYAPSDGSTRSFREEIIAAADADADGELADPSILHAYADHMVWHRPEEIDEDDGEHFATLIRDAAGEDLDYTIIPEVMEITRIAPDDDTADLRGRYVLVPRGTRYLSPFADAGAAPPGVLGLRVVALRPEDDA